MARKVNVIKVCDMHGNEEVPANATVQLAVNGQEVELDLCQDDADQFNQAMSRWIDAGRKTSSGRKRSGTRRSTPRDTHDPKAIRSWARQADGIEVPARGRIPQSVIEQYEAAH